MSVTVIAFVIARERSDGNTDVKPFMQVITMAEPSTFMDAIAYMKSTFAETEHAKDGWHLQGDPVLFDLHSGHVKDWDMYIAPAPVRKSTRDHLKVVK